MSIAPFERGNRIKLENPMQRVYGKLVGGRGFRYGGYFSPEMFVLHSLLIR